MIGLGWTLLGLAAAVVAGVVRMISDRCDGLEVENAGLRRRVAELEGRTDRRG
jgi:hypothetical protein